MTNSEKDIKSESSTKKVFEGEVVSCGMQKTIVVKVSRMFKHPLLGKTIKTTKKYKAHDEDGIANLCDWVEIEECRPLSKTKHMKLNCVLRKAG